MWKLLKEKLGINELSANLNYLLKKNKPMDTTINDKIEVLFRLVFKDDFIDNIDYERRYNILRIMGKNKAINDFLKNRYTKIYKSAIFDRNTGSSEYQKGVFAGRVIELMSLLKEMEDASVMEQEEYLNHRKKIDARKQHFNIEEKDFSSHLINKTY